MNYRNETITELREKKGRVQEKHAMLGFDGFVDQLYTPVQARHGRGTEFEPFLSLRDLGERIAAAAGKSTNIEFYPKLTKLGGNGPIMAYALVGAGLSVQYIGALGKQEIHPVFGDLAVKTNALSVCDPGISMLAECDDGKCIFGNTSPLDELSYGMITSQIGEDRLQEAIAASDLIALVNWTMIPGMTDILQDIAEKVLPAIPKRDERIFFFDLCDPAKRSEGDLLQLLNTLNNFEPFGRVTLGLNLSEAEQVWRVLRHERVSPLESGLREMAEGIRKDLEISMVLIHPTDSAACATVEDSFWVEGPYTEKPRISTGAGDHFNAGFALGQLLGLTPPACLTVAVTFSGYYVRETSGPTIDQVIEFIEKWESA